MPAQEVPVAAPSTKWWKQGPATQQEKESFFTKDKIKETHPPETSIINTPCQVWLKTVWASGVPTIKFRGAMRSAAQVYAFLKYGETPEEGSKISQCGNPRCLEHRSSSNARKTALPSEVSVFEALPEELNDWEGFEVQRADKALCTKDFVCYHCGGEFTPGNTVRVTKAMGIITAAVRTFDPCTSYNDTLCDACIDPLVPLTRGTHFETPSKKQQFLTNYVEDNFIAYLDALPKRGKR